MGCVSSKILTRSQSLNEEVTQSFRSRPNGLLVSKNSNDHLLALLCTANTVAKKLNREPLANKTQNAPPKLTSSKSIGVEEADKDTYQSSNHKDIETINTWELLDGLDDDNDKAEEEPKFDDGMRTRSFRTVEDFDAMVAKTQSYESEKSLTSECSSSSSPVSSEHDADGDSQNEIVDLQIEKGWKRKAMAKELTNLKFSAFEFSRTVSLREWLLVGGQMHSPGSYVTPKFGDFDPHMGKNCDTESHNAVFDPVLVSEFEEAMQKLTMEEEFILKQIVDSQEEADQT
ncbi:hypothetical protein J5N97_005327 [Dioscorea zingiberensis]|uniref:Uncharacterized protein n=1 Tax=Dioscorea zingiberensis TaxID=325984 RepID=A0A9D5HSL5_9LILI|nr:hypothetical protein J5N97_005327 [Dioscorea zingiberensis]